MKTQPNLRPAMPAKRDGWRPARFNLARILLGVLSLGTFGVRPLQAYTLTGSHWTTSPITMQLQLGSASTTLADGSISWGASAEDALATWNNNIGANRFAVVRDSTATKAEGNGINNVFFSGTVYGQAWGTGVLAVTLTYTSGGTRNTECDVLFNSTLTWDSYRGALRYSTAGTGIYDFHRVAMHEFGHVLGLDHPDQAGQTVVALMNSRISNLDTLATDDINGAQLIYGANTSVAAAPVITTQPSSQSATVGQNVSFSVVASSSSSSLSYQWYKSSSAISGATGAALTLSSVTTAAAGNYTVVVTNSAGSVTSSVATLTVTNPVVAPAITTQPASQTAQIGSSVSFTVAASGTAPFTYAWRKDGATISGATAATYTISATKTPDAGNYTAVVTNSAGSATSSSATLTVSSLPVITTQPASQSVAAGDTVTFSVTANGYPAPTYQWLKNNAVMTGATSASYTISSATTSDAGNYTVRVSNSGGTVTSNTAVLTVNLPPAITTAPMGTTVSVGASISLSVVATGSPAPAYQWQKNGQNIAGATQATYTIATSAPTDSGTYNVVVTNVAGSVTTVPVLVTVNYSQLVNISTRGFVPSGGALTAGFVLRGTAGKLLLVRGIGPTLTHLGVSGVLTDPQLAVIAQSTSQTLAVNDGWSVTPQLSTTFQSVGAFSLPTGSSDAASQLRLMPGAYTTRITSSTPGLEGVALAEVYDAEASTIQTRLINVSSLGYTGTSEQSLVAGFVIQGNAPKRLLVRAVGPGLAQLNVTGWLTNPRLDIYPAGQSTPTAGNDDWAGTSDLVTAASSSGAFPLPTGSADAALIVSLAPGTYTVVVTGVGGATGYALVELYDLDP